MSSFAVFVATVLAVIICCKIFRALFRGRINGIPEPTGNLVLGHLLRLGEHFGETFLRWKNDLGPVFQLRILTRRVLVLNDAESIKRVSSLNQASGQPKTGAYDYFKRHFGIGLASDDGPFQKEQRKYFLRMLPRFGESRQRLESTIKFELQQLVSKWAAGKELELEAACSGLVLNSVLGCVADKRLEDGHIKRLLKGFDKMMDSSTNTKKFIFVFTRFVEKFCPNLVRETFSGVVNIVEMTKDILDEHQQDRVPDQPRNLIDNMLDIPILTAEQDSRI